MPGPQRQPTKLRILRGNPSKRPLPKNEPDPKEARPPKPRGLKGEAAAEWNRLVDRTASMRVLTEVDDRMLEITARAYAEYDALAKIVSAEGFTYETDTKNGHRIVARPEVAMASDAWRRYERGLSHFGLSPSTRGKVQTAKPADDGKASKGRKYFGG